MLVHFHLSNDCLSITFHSGLRGPMTWLTPTSLPSFQSVLICAKFNYYSRFPQRLLLAIIQNSTQKHDLRSLPFRDLSILLYLILFLVFAKHFLLPEFFFFILLFVGLFIIWFPPLKSRNLACHIGSPHRAWTSAWHIVRDSMNICWVN